jgi:DNA-binding NarL/FixJ family response regulator
VKSPPPSVRVLLADDHTLVRAGLRALLEKIPGVAVVGEANDGREAVRLVQEHGPDVVLMDIGMPGLNGLEATARVVEARTRTRVIILSMHQAEEYVWRALKAGAYGYLLKKAATSEMAAAITEVMGGEVYLSREISTQFLKRVPLQGTAQWKSPLDELTPRQREILQLIAEGENTKGIALTLDVSPKTVEYHRARLMEELKIRDIPGLVRLALRFGVTPEEG